MNIYSCVDNNNIDKIFVLFFSVYKNTNKKDKLKFYLITDDYPKIKIPEFLSDKLKIAVISFDEYWNKILHNFNENFYKMSSWCKSNLNFARFFIFDLFPDLDRVIYLDWDMIVQDDIFNLEESYNSDKIIVAQLKNNLQVKDNILIRKNLNLTKLENLLDIKINSESFNSGFYILSRSHFKLSLISKTINKLIDIQKQHNIFKFGTQVIMNVLFKELSFIDHLWNTSLISDESKIIHWSGNNKPWKNNDNVWNSYKNELYN